MEILSPIITLLLFPAGLFVMGNGLAYLWVDRKLVAQYQNRIGPRWFQPLADIVKLLSKEEIVPRRHRRAALQRPAGAGAGLRVDGGALRAAGRLAAGL